MLTALKNRQRLSQISQQLLKLSLTGDDIDYWRVYDSLLQMFGYVRIDMNDHLIFIKQNQQQNYLKYQQMALTKISQIDQLQKSQMKRFWQSQIKLYNNHQHSDKFQSINNHYYYCILTSISFNMNMQINKHNDFRFSPYAFVSEDVVVYSNSCAQKKGILKGLPTMLAQHIDHQTKFIQINKHSNRTKWTQLFEISTQRYKALELTNNNNEQIHFMLVRQQNDMNNDNNDNRLLLEQQLKLMIEDIYSISGVRLVGIVTRSQMVSQLIANNMSLSALTHNNYPIQPIILLTTHQIHEYLNKSQLSILPYLSNSHIRLLNSLNINTINQLLQNLHLIQLILSRQQTLIILQTCLGIDHRNNQQYISQKQHQFHQLNLNYSQKYLIQQHKNNYITINTIQGLNLLVNNKNNKEQQQQQKDKHQNNNNKLTKTNNNLQQSDMQSIKSQKLHQPIQSKQLLTSKHPNTKSQHNYNKSSSISISTKQQSLTGFVVKKNNKK